MAATRTDAPRSSRDDVLRDFRREQIVDAALRLFAERGADIAVDQIAAEAGVARSTVYVYFANRDAILLAAIERGRAAMAGRLRERLDPDTPPAERLGRLIATTLEQIDSDPRFYRLVLGLEGWRGQPGTAALSPDLAVIGDEWRSLLTSVLEDGVATGAFRPVDVPTTLRTLGSLVFGALVIRAQEPDPLPADRVAADLCRFALDGLAP